jgi:hypothetical protein
MGRLAAGAIGIRTTGDGRLSRGPMCNFGNFFAGSRFIAPVGSAPGSIRKHIPELD